jgi:hypothetical protein
MHAEHGRAAWVDERLAADPERCAMNYPEPKISFEIEPDVIYTSELQRLVADCRRRANDDFINYSVGKLQRDGMVAPDWPVHISISVGRDAVSWSLASKSGHRFNASCPEHRAD